MEFAFPIDVDVGSFVHAESESDEDYALQL